MLYSFLIYVTEESGPDLVVIIASRDGKLRSFDHICEQFGMTIPFGYFTDSTEKYVRLRFEHVV